MREKRIPYHKLELSKLNNIEDSAYLEQLKGYKKYIETKTSKCVKIYLYSIINGELKELKGWFYG